METVLGDPAEAEAALPALVRMVRERDGNVDGLVRDLEQRAVGPRRLAGMLALASIERLGGRSDAAERRLRALLDDPAGRRDPTPRLRLAGVRTGRARRRAALLREAWERREGGDGARALRRDEQPSCSAPCATRPSAKTTWRARARPTDGSWRCLRAARAYGASLPMRCSRGSVTPRPRWS